MKKIFGFLFSTPLMGAVLLTFALSIATATFIESKFGASTARAVVYNSLWFEILLFLGIINITGVIIKKQLYKREKLTLFIFHLAFVIILLGSAITRFFGFEGIMHIRNGNTENKIVSNAKYIYAITKINDQKAEKSKKIFFSELSNNYHKLELYNGGKKAVVECTGIIPNAIKVAKIIPDGSPILELQIAGFQGKHYIALENGKTNKVEGYNVSLNNPGNTEGINILLDKSGLFINSPYKLLEINMFDRSQVSIPANTFYPFKMKTLYVLSGLKLVATNFYPSAEIDVVTSTQEQNSPLPTIVKFRVSYENQLRELYYIAQENTLNKPDTFSLGGLDFTIGYSARLIELPFNLRLDEFILKHYPGSMSPSWFESKITLIDPAKTLTQQHSIFMNNVLKYKGYRFYQSSYDNDEMGTILSVNHDFWGTMITYLGYLLMSIGMALSLMNPNSHFRQLSKNIDELKEKKKNRKTATIVAILAFVPLVSAQAQMQEQMIIPKEQAKIFGKILVQDPGGRIKPLNTLSSELLRKISRSNTFMNQSADQVFLGMLSFPEYWQTIPMIKVPNPDIRNLLKTNNKLVSFNDFFVGEHENQYILSNQVFDAYSKNPATRSKFDNEIIRLDEKVNLCNIIYTGEMLKIFPKPADKLNVWYHPGNARRHFTGNDSIFVSNILNTYLDNLRESLNSNNWTNNEASVDAIIAFQKKYGKDVLPADLKVRAELLYNNLDIFQKLGPFYGFIGMILLIFQFIGIFIPKYDFKIIHKIAFSILFACFIFHLLGLGLRWYISDHAPWSNGYESMTYVAFATILAGILFYRKSVIVLSATAILASIILFIAHLSYMDPAITNLVPVLKSYWLVFHVAVIISSYGFFALAALTASINLIIMIFQNNKNFSLTEITIKQLSAIIEMSVIIGLYLLTIGTFLGAVWANESWGRYWGWDPKETWALVTILWYALMLHLRLIPGVMGYLTFNVIAVLSFGTVIMTYFGVNYYLTGLHSYAAKGNSVLVSSYFYLTIMVMVAIITIALIKQKLLKNKRLSA